MAASDLASSPSSLRQCASASIEWPARNRTNANCTSPMSSIGLVKFSNNFTIAAYESKWASEISAGVAENPHSGGIRVNLGAVPGTICIFGSNSSSLWFGFTVVRVDSGDAPLGRSASEHETNSTDARTMPHSGAQRDITSAVMSSTKGFHLWTPGKSNGARNLQIHNDFSIGFHQTKACHLLTYPIAADYREFWPVQRHCPLLSSPAIPLCRRPIRGSQFLASGSDV